MEAPRKVATRALLMLALPVVLLSGAAVSRYDKSPIGDDPEGISACERNFGAHPCTLVTVEPAPPPTFTPLPQGAEQTAWTVVGAGLGRANGIYYRTGTYNGHPAMIGRNGQWLFCTAQHVWCLADFIGGPVLYVSRSADAEGAWQACGGRRPAPTVRLAPRH